MFQKPLKIILGRPLRAHAPLGVFCWLEVIDFDLLFGSLFPVSHLSVNARDFGQIAEVLSTPIGGNTERNCIFSLDVLRPFFLRSGLLSPYMKNGHLRSPSDKVGGLVYFGRMVDQIRAHANGGLPPEFQAYLGKSLDEQCVNFLGVSYNQVVEYVNEGASDEAILESCFGMGHRPSEAEVYIWNEFMLKRGWHDDAARTLKQLKREQGLTARSEIETIFQLIDAAEGRAVHANQYDGSYLDQMSLVVGGRRSTLSSCSHLNGSPYRPVD